MNTENNNETIGNDYQQDTEQQPKQSGRTFTQEEVNKIVAERLARDRKQRDKLQQDETAAAADPSGTDPAEADAGSNTDVIDARLKRLECMEYVLQQGYPKELLDVVNTDDVEAFKQYADMMHKVYAARQVAPVIRDGGEVLRRGDPNADLRAAFSREAKHTPKQPKEFF